MALLARAASFRAVTGTTSTAMRLSTVAPLVSVLNHSILPRQSRGTMRALGSWQVANFGKLVPPGNMPNTLRLRLRSPPSPQLITHRSTSTSAADGMVQPTIPLWLRVRVGAGPVSTFTRMDASDFNLETLWQALLQDPHFQKEIEKLDLAYEKVWVLKRGKNSYRSPDDGVLLGESMRIGQLAAQELETERLRDGTVHVFANIHITTVSLRWHWRAIENQNEEAQPFYDAVRKGNVQISDDGKVLSLQEAAWPHAASPTDKLFVRDYFEPLYQVILDEKRKMDLGQKIPWLTLYGQPGIGKSMYGDYLIYRFLQEGYTVISKPSAKSDFAVIYHNGVAYAHPHASIGSAFFRGIPKLVQILDSDARGEDKIFTITIHSAGGWRDVPSDYENSISSLLMAPTPSAEEMQLLHQRIFDHLSPEDVARRMSVWGNNPRRVFVNIDDRLQRAAWDLAKSAKMDQLQDALHNITGVASSRVCHKFLEERCAGQDDKQLSMNDVRYYYRGKTLFVSPIMAKFVAATFSTHLNLELLQTLEHSANIASLKTWRGHTWEDLVCDAITKYKVPVKIRKLPSDVNANDVKETSWHAVNEVYESVHHLRSKWEQWSAHPEPLLLRPKSKTHETFDAIYMGDSSLGTTPGGPLLLQFTMAAKHDVDLSGLKSARITFGLDKPLRLVFVVPEEVSHEWRTCMWPPNAKGTGEKRSSDAPRFTNEEEALLDSTEQYVASIRIPDVAQVLQNQSQSVSAEIEKLLFE